MKKMICFDMDGTIADLYNVNEWLPMLRAEDPTPYLIAKPMWDMNALRGTLLRLIEKGWEIRIITWLSKDSSEEYKELTRDAKKAWLSRYNFPYTHFHGVQYGTTKADCVRSADYAVLIDDNAKVRQGWHKGVAIDPTTMDIIEVLEGL